MTQPRPGITPSLIRAVLDALDQHHAVGVAVPTSDTIFEVRDGIVASIPDRANLWQAQTPQGFRFGVLRAAHHRATLDPHFLPTDDCGVVMRYLPETHIGVIPGSERTMKLTHRSDIAVVEAILDDLTDPDAPAQLPPSGYSADMAEQHEVEWLEVPELRRPLLVVALEGLFDAAMAATSATQHIVEASDAATVIARIDPETFFDFQQRRPEVFIDEDGTRRLSWPDNIVHHVPTHGPHDLLLLSGVEPHLRWRTFTQAIEHIAMVTEAEMVVTLGAMVGMAPHTRPLGVVGSATDAELAERLGLGRPSYQGPTGVVGVLHDRLDAANIPVISLRVSIPHYVPSPPNPEATRSLLRRLELITGVATAHQKGIAPGGVEIIVARNNFHGRTLGALSLSTAPGREVFGPLMGGFPAVPFGNAAAIENAITERTAAVLLEPIQGEGGIVVPPPGYLKQVRALCDAHGLALVLDEIQVGLGRTGRLFDHLHEDVLPDVLLVGKSLGGGLLPVSAVVGRADILECLRPGDHGSTFGGNPLAAAVARESLRVIVEENLAERAALNGDLLRRRLRELPEREVVDVRGRGLALGLELRSAERARNAVTELAERGVLCQRAGATTIRLTPPLTIEPGEIEWAADRMHEVLGRRVPAPVPKIRVRMADDGDREAIYGLRHRVFAHELGQHRPNGDGRLTDAVDDHNHYIVVERDGELLAFVSVTPPGAPRFAIDKYFGTEEVPVERNESFELRLLAVDPRARGLRLSHVLLMACLRWGEAQGWKSLVCTGHGWTGDFYRRLGMQPTGLSTRSGDLHLELLTATVERIKSVARGPLEAVVHRFRTGALRWDLDTSPDFSFESARCAEFTS